MVCVLMLYSVCTYVLWLWTPTDAGATSLVRVQLSSGGSLWLSWLLLTGSATSRFPTKKATNQGITGSPQFPLA